MTRYMFEPDDLTAIVSRHLTEPIEAQIELVTCDLVDRYGTLIEVDNPWVFSNAGGIMGTLKVLAASLREYLAFFGTPYGTEGHSGRHRADLYDIVMAGELWTYEAHDKRATVHRPGDVAVLRRGRVNGSKIPDSGCWTLEYGRGNVPSLLPFALAETFTTTLELGALRDTMVSYNRCMLRTLRARRSLL